MTEEQRRKYLCWIIWIMLGAGGILAFQTLMELQDNKDVKVIKPIFIISAIAVWVAYTLAAFFFSQDSSQIILFIFVIVIFVLLPATLFSMSTGSIISSNL
jgi:fatty acid desaturase